MIQSFFTILNLINRKTSEFPRVKESKFLGGKEDK